MQAHNILFIRCTYSVYLNIFYCYITNHLKVHNIFNLKFEKYVIQLVVPCNNRKLLGIIET